MAEVDERVSPRTETGKRLLENPPTELPEPEWWSILVRAIEVEAIAIGRDEARRG